MFSGVAYQFIILFNSTQITFTKFHVLYPKTKLVLLYLPEIGHIVPRNLY